MCFAICSLWGPKKDQNNPFLVSFWKFLLRDREIFVIEAESKHLSVWVVFLIVKRIRNRQINWKRTLERQLKREKCDSMNRYWILTFSTYEWPETYLAHSVYSFFLSNTLIKFIRKLSSSIPEPMHLNSNSNYSAHIIHLPVLNGVKLLFFKIATCSFTNRKGFS